MTTILPLAKTPTAPAGTVASCSLPALIDRARTRLAEARTSAEVLEARAAAKAALHYARLQKAANETQADCLAMIKRAEIRMANELDRKPNAQGRRSDFVRTSDEVNPTLTELGLSRQRVAEWRELRDAGEAVIDEAIQEALDEGRAPTHADIQRAACSQGTARAVKGSHHRTRFTGENEWYTPAPYVEAARACLGAIDLDPASSAAAQATVRAARFFTRDEDGLRHEWRGRIWLNPPYAQPDIVHFVDKLLAEVNAGRPSDRGHPAHPQLHRHRLVPCRGRTVRRHLLHPRPDPLCRRFRRDCRTDARASVLLLRRRPRPVPRQLRQLRVHPMTAATG